MEMWTSSSAPWQSTLSNTSSSSWTFHPENNTWMTLNQTTPNISLIPAGRVPGPRRGYSPLSDDIRTLQMIYRHLDQVMPVTLSLGIVGNILAVVTFMTSPLKFVSLSHYLSALAVADVMNLLAGLILWVSHHGWNLYTKVGFCQLTSFVLLMSR
ncbi:hypothetical protein ACOMHN_060591 [Nucella lapillus]